MCVYLCVLETLVLLSVTLIFSLVCANLGFDFAASFRFVGVRTVPFCLFVNFLRVRIFSLPHRDSILRF